MKIFKKINILLIGIIILLSFHVVNAANLKDAFDLGSDSEKKALGAFIKEAGYDEKKTDPIAIAGSVINIIISLLGIIFLGLTIYGGIRWMIARGNEQEVSDAKNIINTSIIGLVIVIMAYTISWYVISEFSKAGLDTSGSSSNSIGNPDADSTDT